MTVQPDVKSDTKVPDAEQKIQAVQQTTPVAEASKPVEETQEQINWRKFRQERERERKEKAESDKRLAEKEKEALALKAALDSVLNKPAPQQQYVDEGEETEDQRIEKKVNKVLQEKEKTYEIERQKREAAELPQKLVSTFSDFNEVCSQENMDYLQYHYPDVYAGFKHSSGNFDVWAGLYKTIKRFVPNVDGRKEMAKIEKNLSKPQSMSTPGATQTGDHAPTELTEKRRQDNWVRMQRTMKGLK